MKSSVVSIIYSCLLVALVVYGKPVKKHEKDPIEDPSNLIDYANRKIEGNHEVIEVDYKLPPLHKRRARAATLVDYWKWEGHVPYTFDTVLPISDLLKNFTLQSFAHIEEHSCVRFIPRTTEEDYINITSLTGCWSYIGKTGGMQEYSLASTGCSDFDVVLHETMHALGFYHEHSRPDRDDYIVVNFTNVLSGAVEQLQKFNLTSDTTGDITLQNISYDKQSVMHYGRYTFTKHIDNDGYLIPGQQYMTMYSKDDPEEYLGSTNGLSYKDKLRLNLFYGCNTSVPTPSTDTTTPVVPTTTGTSTTGTTMSVSTSQQQSTSSAQQSTQQSTSTSQQSTTDSQQSSTNNLITPETTPDVSTTTTSTTTTTTTTTTTLGPVVTTTANTTNGTEWGKPDHGTMHRSSLSFVVLILFTTIAFTNIR